MCSAHVPLYSGLVPPSYRGVVSIKFILLELDFSILSHILCTVDVISIFKPF